MTRLAVALVAALLAADAPAPAVERDRALAEVAAKIAEAHRKADALEKQGEPTQAVAELAAVQAQPLPDCEEGWNLQADLAARISQLTLRVGDVDGARHAAKKGLDDARGKPASIYVAQLWLRLGEAREAAKDDDGAVNAYQSAIEVAKAALAPSQDAGRAQ
ncbi:MAG: hypothetical protein QM765_46000 [Myxococcales bacterium]